MNKTLLCSLFISAFSLLITLRAEITATISPAELTVATGETVNFEFKYSCSEGETLYSHFLPIERKDAPHDFFAKTTRTINRHASNDGYDNIFLVPYAVLNPPQSDGVVSFSISLNDFVPGNYACSFRARFMKDGQEINELYPIRLTVTPQMPPTRRTLAGGEVPNLEDYLIYCDEDATPSVKAAAKELQEFIQKTSGVKLPLYNQPLPPFIAVGASNIAKEHGIDGEALPEDGYVLKTIDNNLFIVGREMPNDGRTKMYGHSFGTRAGVRAFLEKHLGIMWLLPGERGLYIPKRSPKAPLPQLDEQYAPFFQYRLHWPICGRTPLINQWLEFNMGEHIGSRYDGAPHSWIWLYPTPSMQEAKAVLDRESTYRKNPNLFELSKDGKRVMPNAGEVFSLCLGNPETTEDIIDRIVKLNMLRDELEPEFKGLRFNSLTPSDTCPNCACEACQKGRHAIDPKEIGTMSYELKESWTELVFESDRIICERLPDYRFTSYIYHSTQFPYKGMKPMPKNFTGDMAPLHCGYGPVRYCEAVNQTWRNWMKSWDGLLAQRIYYGLDFWIRQYFGAPQPPCLQLMKETFEAFVERNFVGVEWYLNTGYGQCGMSTWVLLKMSWNPKQDPFELANTWLKAAYGEKAAPAMMQLYMLVEEQTRNFYNACNGRYGWDMDGEMLSALYAPIYPKLEELYLQAFENAGDDDQHWRLSKFGDNLKLLRYTLINMGFMNDYESPLRMTAAQYDQLSRSRLPGGENESYVSPAPTPGPTALSADVNVEITDDLAKEGEFQPIACQAWKEWLIMPRNDGVCELVFEGATRKDHPTQNRKYMPPIEFYSVYSEDRTLIQAGIAEKGVIRFPVEKGKFYRFLYQPENDFATQPYWHLKSCSEPFVMGHHHDGAGLRFYDIKTPLWFYVDDKTTRVEIFASNTYFSGMEIELKDPSGKTAASIHEATASTAALEAPATPGWWKIGFTYKDRGFCGYIRLGSQLTKYVVIDPKNALKVTEKTANP